MMMNFARRKQLVCSALALVVISCAQIAPARGQFLFSYEINPEDDSRAPKSSLFDPSSFKIVTPSQLQSSYQKISSQLDSTAAAATRQQAPQQQQSSAQQVLGAPQLTPEAITSAEPQPQQQQQPQPQVQVAAAGPQQQQSLLKQTSAALQSFAELFNLSPSSSPSTPLNSATLQQVDQQAEARSLHEHWIQQQQRSHQQQQSQLSSIFAAQPQQQQQPATSLVSAGQQLANPALNSFTTTPTSGQLIHHSAAPAAVVAQQPNTAAQASAPAITHHQPQQSQASYWLSASPMKAPDGNFLVQIKQPQQQQQHHQLSAPTPLQQLQTSSLVDNLLALGHRASPGSGAQLQAQARNALPKLNTNQLPNLAQNSFLSTPTTYYPAPSRSSQLPEQPQQGLRPANVHQPQQLHAPTSAPSSGFFSAPPTTPTEPLLSAPRMTHSSQQSTIRARDLTEATQQLRPPANVPENFAGSGAANSQPLPVHKSAEETLISYRQQQQLQKFQGSEATSGLQHNHLLPEPQQAHQNHQQHQQQPSPSQPQRGHTSDIPKVSPQIYESFLLQQRDQHEKHMELLKQQQELNKLLEQKQKQQKSHQEEELRRKRKKEELDKEARKKALREQEQARKLKLEQEEREAAARRRREQEAEEERKRLAEEAARYRELLEAREREAKLRRQLEEERAEKLRLEREREAQLAKLRRQAEEERELKVRLQREREEQEAAERRRQQEKEAEEAKQQRRQYLAQQEELRKLLELKQREEELQQQQRRRQQQQQQQAQPAQASRSSQSARANRIASEMRERTGSQSWGTPIRNRGQNSTLVENSQLATGSLTAPAPTTITTITTTTTTSTTTTPAPVEPTGRFRSGERISRMRNGRERIVVKKQRLSGSQRDSSGSGAAASNSSLTPAYDEKLIRQNIPLYSGPGKYGLYRNDSLASDLAALLDSVTLPATSSTTTTTTTSTTTPAPDHESVGRRGGDSNSVTAGYPSDSHHSSSLSPLLQRDSPPASSRSSASARDEPIFDDDVPRRPARGLPRPLPQQQQQQQQQAQSQPNSPAAPTSRPVNETSSGASRTAHIGLASLPPDSDNDGIPGRAGVEYPVLSSVPPTSFSCSKQPLNGYYADTETACQVVHLCQGGAQSSILCPNGTIFNQEKFSCQWWYEVNCSRAPIFYQLNDNLYKSLPVGADDDETESNSKKRGDKELGRATRKEKSTAKVNLLSAAAAAVAAAAASASASASAAASSSA